MSGVFASDDVEVVDLPAATLDLAAVLDTLEVIRPGQTFRPSDPREEAHAQATPSGLLRSQDEDATGMEAAQQFGTPRALPDLTAVDAGIVRLGNTEDGMVAIVRAAAITYCADGHVQLRRVRPGLVYISAKNRLGIFHQMGEAMGKPGFYVELDDDGIATGLKSGVATGPHDHRLMDRLRNFVERKLQEHLIATLPPGILLIDGALTLRTYDTPGPYLQRLADHAYDRDINLIAVAKKTGLSIQGIDIVSLLDEPGRPTRRKLTRAIKAESGEQNRFLGDLYVARFAPGGDTYRVDVNPISGETSAAVLDQLYAAARFRSGYPEPLLTAHIHSYLTPPVVAQLQAHAVATYGLAVKPDINLSPIFAPFGGRFK